MSKAHLVKPSLARLPAYVAALKQGWSPDNLREAQVAEEHLEQISRDASRFLQSQDDQGATGDPIQLPDGSFIPRLPSFTRWIWDGEFCGSIELRWQLGSPLLPAHVLGHIGYTIVPWKRGVGHAKQALTCMLQEARQRGLAYVDLTTDPANISSQKVILACGGNFLERFRKEAAYGGSDSFRYRIIL